MDQIPLGVQYRWDVKKVIIIPLTHGFVSERRQDADIVIVED